MDLTYQCLQVYVSPHCVGCDEATALAEHIAREFSSVRVEVIDVQSPAANLPTEIFATPTYVWNGRVYSLGNPARAVLVAMIATELGGQ